MGGVGHRRRAAHLAKAQQRVKRAQVPGVGVAGGRERSPGLPHRRSLERGHVGVGSQSQSCGGSENSRGKR